MLQELEIGRKNSKKGNFSVKKTTFEVRDSPAGIQVDSWRMHDWDYKRRDLPTYARGLFTTKTRRNQPEIAVRGYDKFFNIGEVNETKWDNICSQTRGPYELTLKENGCIIFVAGLEDDTLIVCSKHSTGDRSDVELSHASAGERRIEQQLAAIGKTKTDLARELRQRNATAVAELCDDSFEEHILAYGPDKAGLYLHGVNLNLPEFATYPSPAVQDFADQWGFRKVELTTMTDVSEVKAFLEEVAETGAHDGRDVEGFVVRCKRSHSPSAAPYQDWFFKFKFEEPYLMYRQWRECTKALIAGRTPKFKKHAKITEEYLLYARQRLAADKELGRLYNQNHGIIALRDDFLAFKNLKGSDAANLELSLDSNDNGPAPMTEVTGDVILCPIATIGCGKTTIALALNYLFGWGHIQNDNIQGKGRPSRFTAAVLDQLKQHPVVFADRNNAGAHERKQLIKDVKLQHSTAKLVCLHFLHTEDTIEDIRRITQERIISRGDNHQTIHAATDADKYIGVMNSFVARFEACKPFSAPDNGFDVIINLDPTAESRHNLETTIVQLNKYFPNLVTGVPSPEQLDAALEFALSYKPDLRHDIPDRGKRDRGAQSQQQQQQSVSKKKTKSLEYMAVNVSASRVNDSLDEAFAKTDAITSRFMKQLKQTRRVQPRFHVTLMHRAASKERPELWLRYKEMQEEMNKAGNPEGKVGDCDVLLERIVFDERIMAIVVRLIDDAGRWECVNQTAHITVGTRDDSVKPKESNDLLARWLKEGCTADNQIQEVVFDSRPVLRGEVKPVLSR